MPVSANALIDIVALVIAAIVMFADRRIATPAQESRRDFRALLMLLAGVLLLDIPAWLLDGRIFPGARTLSYVLDTLYYLCQIVFCYVWMLFADYWNHHPSAWLRRHKWLHPLPMLLEVAVILTNPATGWIFTVSDGNVYTRGSHYLINLIPYYLYIVGSLLLTMQGFLRAQDQGRKRQSLIFIVFMFLPICGVVLETLFYGISWLWPFTALSLLMVYLSVQQQQLAEQRFEALQQAEEAQRLRNELTNSRIAIMLSQMQPHFLFNALASIKALCTRDPLLAAQATGNFADFLRSNMDSLTDDKPISFLQELEHTKHYLALEQIRFRDRLHVEYDIQADLFRLPTLTMQPIVENAVRYCTMQRVEGGTVRIATKETENAYVITVSDDGVGFDPSQEKNDGHSHIGIRNVSDRLRSISGGTLTVDSTPGVGTTVVITIPKQALPGDKPC